MTVSFQLKTLVELIKPKALLMIVLATCMGYLIATVEAVDLMHLFHMGLGVGLAAAGSLALNQHMERKLDAQMARTRNRPLPSGRITPKIAFIYGVLLMLSGYTYLWQLVNPACSIATIACGLSYLYLYTPLKRRSSFSSFVGAIPGGLLPVMGWVAARGQLELGAWLLFVILFLWQIPHALIISIRHQDDYQAVGMKQLPLVSHGLTSRRQMILNVLILLPVSIMPAFINLTQNTYPFVALLLGLFLFFFVVRYSFNPSDKAAKQVFLMLNLYLPLLLLALYLDKPL